jgi:hypothetical protein
MAKNTPVPDLATMLAVKGALQRAWPNRRVSRKAMEDLTLACQGLTPIGADLAVTSAISGTSTIDWKRLDQVVRDITSGKTRLPGAPQWSEPVDELDKALEPQAGASGVDPMNIPGETLNWKGGTGKSLPASASRPWPEPLGLSAAPETGHVFRLAVDFTSAQEMLGFIRDLRHLYPNATELGLRVQPRDSLDRLRKAGTNVLHLFCLVGRTERD